jgi:hypothetical protein
LSHRAAGPEASRRLEQLGYEMLRSVLAENDVAALEAQLDGVYDSVPPDRRGTRPERANQVYRYEMLNRSALAQQVVAHPRILAAIEPLIGEDCHVIANTCWRDQGGNESPHGGPWHTDAGRQPATLRAAAPQRAEESTLCLTSKTRGRPAIGMRVASHLSHNDL